MRTEFRVRLDGVGDDGRAREKRGEGEREVWGGGNWVSSGESDEPMEASFRPWTSFERGSLPSPFLLLFPFS